LPGSQSDSTECSSAYRCFLSLFYIRNQKRALKIKKKLENNETEQNFSMFIEIPNKDQQRQCYKAFYDATSNAALQLQVCPVCVQENLATQGE
jgi:hypothetical protein